MWMTHELQMRAIGKKKFSQIFTMRTEVWPRANRAAQIIQP